VPKERRGLQRDGVRVRTAPASLPCVEVAGALLDAPHPTLPRRVPLARQPVLIAKEPQALLLSQAVDDLVDGRPDRVGTSSRCRAVVGEG
jgi:hypothetical protein